MSARNDAPSEKVRYPAKVAALTALWTLILLASLLMPGDDIGALATSLERFPLFFLLENAFFLENAVFEKVGLDKIVHAVLFAGETFFLCHWLGALARPRPLAMALLITTLLACFTELGQLAIPHRSGDWLDLAANQIGILLTTLLIFASSQYNPGESHP